MIKKSLSSLINKGLKEKEGRLGFLERSLLKILNIVMNTVFWL